MIVDYNKFTQCLLQKLSEQYKTNYFTVNDVANVINEIKEPLSKQIEITDETKNTIKNMTTKELLKEIIQCANNVTDIWDRDNLIILRFMCNVYENKVDCKRFQDFIRAYNFKKHEIYSCRFACSQSLYGCFMSIIKDKTNEDICIISAAIVEEQYIDKNKKFKLVYNEKENIDDIIATIIAKEIDGYKYLTKEQIDNIKYILAEPDSVTVKKATS